MSASYLKVIALGNGELVRMGKADASALPESQQLTEASLDTWQNQTIVWPEDMYGLVRLLEVNPWHNSCCRLKAQDVTCQGWKLQKADGSTDNPPEELMSFLDNCNPELSLGEVLERCWIDWEATGNFYLEVARQKGGNKFPAALYNAPAHTIRRTKDFRFLQMRGGLLRYFVPFGSPDRERMKLNEVINIINYTPRSTYYGLPDILSALGAITGHVKQRDSNIKYYDNSMMAEFIIMVEGGTLDDEGEKKIQETLKQMKGANQAHKTLLLHIGDKEAKIHIEKLTPELNYTQQRLFRLDNRDEVIQAHRVPPKLIGVEGSERALSSNQAVQLDIYFQSVITPRQKVLGRRLTETIIRRGFGIKDWNLVFSAKVLEDAKQNAEVDQIYLDRGVLLPNEVRAIRFPGKDPLDTGDIPYPFIKNPAQPPFEVTKVRKADSSDLPTVAIEKDLLEAIRPLLRGFADEAAEYLKGWGGTIKRFSKRSLRSIFRKADPEKIILDQMMVHLQQQWAAVSVPLAEVVYEAKVKAGEQAVAVQYERLGIQKEFKLTNQKLLDYYRNEAAQDITGIGENAMARVRAALVTASENGEVVVGQVSARVQSVLEDIPTSRAELIAEQEVTNAYSYLQHESRVRLGIKSKQWVSQADDQVRPDHQIMNGKTVGVNMYFILPDGSMGLYPRDRSLSAKESIRCRCDLRDIVDDGWNIPPDPWGGE